jgi:hypothetical protein
MMALSSGAKLKGMLPSPLTIGLSQTTRSTSCCFSAGSGLGLELEDAGLLRGKPDSSFWNAGEEVVSEGDVARGESGWNGFSKTTIPEPARTRLRSLPLLTNSSAARMPHVPFGARPHSSGTPWTSTSIESHRFLDAAAAIAESVYPSSMIVSNAKRVRSAPGRTRKLATTALFPPPPLFSLLNQGRAVAGALSTMSRTAGNGVARVERTGKEASDCVGSAFDFSSRPSERVLRCRFDIKGA